MTSLSVWHAFTPRNPMSSVSITLIMVPPKAPWIFPHINGLNLLMESTISRKVLMSYHVRTVFEESLEV